MAILGILAEGQLSFGRGESRRVACPNTSNNSWMRLTARGGLTFVARSVEEVEKHFAMLEVEWPKSEAERYYYGSRIVIPFYALHIKLIV